MGNVSAADKSSGKSETITITNEKGSLSDDDIEKMVADAEQYKTKDEEQRSRISAKNTLETYCYNMKSTLQNDQLKDKISNDSTKILSSCNDAINWLDQNQMAETEEFKDKQKEIEGICNPIISRLYQGGNNAGGAN